MMDIALSDTQQSSATRKFVTCLPLLITDIDLRQETQRQKCPAY